MASTSLQTLEAPSLQDYTAFHGMLCGPDAARRCINSFGDSAVVFSEQSEYDIAATQNTSLQEFDFGKLRFGLNIWSYYLLVVTSLTGLCSLLGLTKVIQAIEYLDTNNTTTVEGDNASSDGSTTWTFQKGDGKYIESAPMSSMGPLRLPPVAMEYVLERSVSLGPLCDSRSTTKAPTIRENGAESSSKEENIINHPELTLIRRFEYDFGGCFSVMMLHFRCTNGRIHLVEIFKIYDRTVLGFVVGNFVYKPLQFIKRMFGLKNEAKSSNQTSTSKKDI